MASPGTHPLDYISLSSLAPNLQPFFVRVASLPDGLFAVPSLASYKSRALLLRNHVGAVSGLVTAADHQAWDIAPAVQSGAFC